MTNLEYIKSLDADEMAQFFCEMADEACTTVMFKCPFRKFCDAETGIQDWLNSDKDSEKNKELFRITREEWYGRR